MNRSKILKSTNELLAYSLLAAFTILTLGLAAINSKVNLDMQ